jgi:hypothetical protein
MEVVMETDYSKAAVMGFISTLSKKGLANAHTADGFRVAARKIFGELSPQEEADVRKIDVALAVKRVHNKNPGKYKPSSLGEYQRRVDTLLKEFVRYQENPTTYTGIGRGAPTATQKAAGKGRGTKAARAAPKATPPTPAPGPGPQPAFPHLALDYPLRPDFLAQVVVPRDLRVEEARRLGAFVMTLAADYTPKDG